MSKSEFVPEKFRPLFRSNAGVGTMKVRIIEATDLPKCDPYVVVNVGKKVSKTRVLKSVENPYWDEEFTIDDVLNATKDVLVMEVRDWNLVLKDSSVGEAEFPLSNLYRGIKTELWLRVHGTKKGQIHVEMTALDFGRDFQIPAVNPQNQPAPVPPPAYNQGYPQIDGDYPAAGYPQQQQQHQGGYNQY